MEIYLYTIAAATGGFILGVLVMCIFIASGRRSATENEHKTGLELWDYDEYGSKEG